MTSFETRSAPRASACLNPGHIVDYVAPDRTELVEAPDLGSTVLVIGHSVFEQDGSNNGVVTGWDERPLTRQLDVVIGPIMIKRVLEALLPLSSVEKSGSRFTVHQVIEAQEVFSGSAGTALITYVVRVSGDHVVHIIATARGTLISYVLSRSGQFEKVSRASLPMVDQRYSKFGAIPPILRPLRS